MVFALHDCRPLPVTACSKAGPENTSGRIHSPDGTFVARLFAQQANRTWKNPVENSWLSLFPLLVFGQRRRQARGQVDAKVVGEQEDDEENVTELISERTVFVFRGPRLVAVTKV